VRPPKLLFLLAFLALPLSAREFDVRPAPAWVETLAVDTSVAIARQNVRWGIYDLLSDHQVRSGESQYFRIVRNVLSPSGVQNASELELDFDPSFERLVLHHVQIVRGGEVLDALEPDEIRVIEKEDESENRIYDGERTALLFLRDVRPGDVIDYAWSLEGANPILNGRYTDSYDLSSAVPTRRMRHRLVWPTGRPLQWRGGDPVIQFMPSAVEASAEPSRLTRIRRGGSVDPSTSLGVNLRNGSQILIWEKRNVEALDVEDGLPSWYEPWHSIEVSEFASWGEVAAWADAMFVLDARSQAEVKALAAKLASEHPTRDARVTAAIRFVQDEIRYLGIEMGRNSHQPHQPWETLASRWGDCKDKTLLLVALLRELGLEAYPALVNTRLQQRLAEKLPSPFLFDHVIAQVVDRSRAYWIDGTISEQGGTLATIETPNDSLALVVHGTTSALTPVVTNMKGGVMVEQIYTTADYAQPTLLVVKTTYSGAEADAVRSELASLSLEDYAHERINDLAIDQPKIEAVGLPLVADNRLRNSVIVTEQYRIPELWKDGEWSWFPRVLGGQLTRPDTMIRTMPLAFAHPLNVRQSVTFNFPEELDVEKRRAVTETPAFRYEYTVDAIGRTVTIRQSLRSRADHVAVQDVPEHLTQLSAIWSEMGYRLAPAGASVPAATASDEPVANWVIGLIVVATFVGICWMLATRTNGGRASARRLDGRAEARPTSFSPGEAPASALRVAHAEEIDARLAELACACGATRYASHDVQRARYAERDLTIVTRHCGTCGREQSVYFTAA
jgi:transglutaminase-like putative cysteine protease